MIRSNPYISVLMTTYNHEKYIKESINSVLNQTFEDFELVIINDGSTDRTGEIIQTFKDNRIKYINQENKGVSIAINNGVLSASGEYIAFMSGDDVCYPQRLERQLHYLSQASQKTLFFSWVDFINEDSQIFSGEPYIQENFFNRENQDRSKILRHFFEKGNYLNAPSAFVERIAILDTNLFHLTSIQAQDFYKWIDLLGKEYEICIIPEKLIKYRVNGKTLSQSQTYNERGRFESEIIINDFFKHISIDLFKRSFSDLIINFDFSTQIEYDLEKAFLYLNYNSLFRKAGITKLFNLLQYPEVLAICEEKYNLSLPVLYKLMANISSSFNPLTKSSCLVSIVIPCYDRALFLHEAVESIISQTYTNWECIIVNDGSSDNTSEVARSLIIQHQNYRISLVEKQNGGLSSARNTGIEVSSGKYILCLDADDKIEADFLCDSMKILEENPNVGFVYTDVQYFGSRTDIISYGDFNPDGFLRNNQATVTSMFRREIFDSIGGYKEIMDGGFEGWEFWISACENGWSGYHLAKACFHYRQHEKRSMLQILVDNKSRLQTLFAKIVSLHPNLYTIEEIAWAHDLLKSSDTTFNTIIFQNSLFQECQRFLFSPPNYFEKEGAAIKYCRYLQKWMSYAHQSIFTDTEDLLCKNIVAKLAKNTNFISAYFNDENLKNIYTKRAEIIELNLQNNGNEVDYQFNKRSTDRKKIRLGILANHFNPSAETFAALPIYEYLSRDFEVILYSLQQTNHPLEQYCRSSANLFVALPQDLSGQVNAIRSDALDILFFATNVTAVTNQICLLATHRLARIQITSGGSVVTTGISNMDYFLSGTFTDPAPDAQEQYREELIQLPGAVHCFSYGDFEEKSILKIDRSDLEIAEDTVVFTSGSNFYKIIPELIHTWAKIIAAVPNSILMLFPFGPNWSSSYPKQAFKEHLYKIFAEYGVSADRVITLDPQPVPNREDLKEYLKIADVYLDSYPFAGTTSLIEPLQVNLPVIARQGNSFRSSMGAAMIRSLDIADLVADSEESYIQLAVVLGNNPELRQQKSAEVQAKMADNPSFLDSKGYGSKIGDLFKELLERYLTKTLSDNLRLRDVNLMVFPDWNQSEESVGLELQQVIQTLATQPDSQKTTLLIDTTDIAIEDAEMFISSVAMNLMMEEDIDITEELEICLIEDLNNIQWQNLLPKIDARIILECDNQAAVDKLPQMQLVQRKIESFVMN